MEKFSSLFLEDDQLHVIKNFPSFVSYEYSKSLIDEVSFGKNELALKIFKKDRSSGPNRWPVELFIFFFDLVKHDLLMVVEQSQKAISKGREG